MQIIREVDVNNSWKKLIEDESLRVWEESEKAFLLSNLPPFLMRHGIDVAQLRGKSGLREFIKNELPPALKILSSDSDPLVWGLLPAMAPLEEPNSRHFSRRDVVKVPASDRYLSSVWTAFGRAVEQGRQRYLILGARIEFVDVDNGQPTPADGILIPREYQVGGDVAQSERANVISEKIAAWADENNVLLSALKKENRAQARSLVYSASDDSLLVRLIFELDESDRRRLSIPLDIIAKLINAKV